MFYIRVCVTYKTFHFWDKTPQKVDNARLRLSLKLWAQCFCMMMWSLAVHSAFMFFGRAPASVRPDLDFLSGAELGLSNERHCVMQSWSLRPNFSQVANNCVFFVSGHLPWALGVWFAEVPSPPSCSLTQWKLLWTRERLFIAQDSEGEGERPYMSQIGLWKFSFPCLQAQPHMQVNTAWQVATSQMTLQFPYSKWEINPFILTSDDWELCSHHLALAEE